METIYPKYYVSIHVYNVLGTKISLMLGIGTYNLGMYSLWQKL